jgi:hypothetical protein
MIVDSSPVPDGPLAAWEQRLRERLTGSSECALEWRHEADAGISKLAVAAKLNDASVDPATEYWTSPSARDWKDTPGMIMNRPDGRSRFDQLPRHMTATAAALGEKVTKQVRANPVFACWLMGWPDAVINGALRALQERR